MQHKWKRESGGGGWTKALHVANICVETSKCIDHESARNGRQFGWKR